MRLASLLVLALLFAVPLGSQQEPTMTLPKVEHEMESHVEKTETTTRTCPAGYEGHFVDIPEGFDAAQRFAHGWATGPSLFDYEGRPSGEPGYTVCFKKSFMDEMRKNTDMTAARPLPPRGL